MPDMLGENSNKLEVYNAENNCVCVLQGTIAQCLERGDLIQDNVRKELSTFINPGAERRFPGTYNEAKRIFKIMNPRGHPSSATAAAHSSVNPSEAKSATNDQDFEYGQIYLNRQAQAKWTKEDSDMLEEAAGSHSNDLEAILSNAKYSSLKRFTVDVLQTKMSRLGFVPPGSSKPIPSKEQPVAAGDRTVAITKDSNRNSHNKASSTGKAASKVESTEKAEVVAGDKASRSREKRSKRSSRNEDQTVDNADLLLSLKNSTLTRPEDVAVDVD